MTAMLEMRNVSKSFAGVQALRDVNFSVEAGQIHALVGENGAGKSTLMKVLSGVYPHGSASILISHKLNEVARVADHITVLRDGRTVDGIDCRTEPVEEDRIIRSMVNRDLAHRFPERCAKIGEPVLTVGNWSVYHPIH